MKKRKILFTLLISILFTSCASTSYFQVYKTVPSEKVVLRDNLLVYEDENCMVSYDLWSNGGNIGFQFFNKTDNNIYLNLEESFFILNGVSYNYFKNRVYTTSTNSGATISRSASAYKSVTGINYSDLLQTNKISVSDSKGLMTSGGFSVSYAEEKIVCVPSKTSKIISEYIINESLLSDCDLLRYPTPKQIKTKTFSKEQSPLVFSNRIAYTIGKNVNLVKLENEFYVAEIANYPESVMFDSMYEEFCDEKSTYATWFFRNDSADKFYIKYSKGLYNEWKH